MAGGTLPPGLGLGGGAGSSSNGQLRQQQLCMGSMATSLDNIHMQQQQHSCSIQMLHNQQQFQLQQPNQYQNCLPPPTSTTPTNTLM